MGSANPHIRAKHSPLSALVMSALRRFGDFSPESVSGEAAHMFLEFANAVVAEWNFHPTLERVEGFEPVEDYVAIDEAREIPDNVMREGLLAYYSSQQVSEKAGMHQSLYYMTLNREAHKRYTGGLNTPIEMQETR